MGRKRGIALLLSAMLVCALCLTALPKTALAVEDYTMDFTLSNATWANGANFQDRNARVVGTDWIWQWDHSTTPPTPTLTLSGLNFTTSQSIAMHLPANTTVFLEPGTTNAITSGAGSNCYGLLCDASGGDLTITGGGSLTVTSGGATQYGCKGIHVMGNLIVSGGSKVTGIGGNAPEYSQGIFSRGLTVMDTSKVEGRSGGTAAAKTNIGISIDGAVRVSDSAKLTGIAGAAVNQSRGVSANATTITGGTILASSGAAPVTGAFSSQPNLGGYSSYSWRTASTGSFTPNTVRPYVWNESHTYLEIRPGSGGPAVPRTDDSAQPWLWAGLVMLAGAGLAASAILRRKQRTAG